MFMCRGEWDWDQNILSWSLLSSGLCGLDTNNKLWSTLGLAPRDSQGQCWGGSTRYDDCNSGMAERNKRIINQVRKIIDTVQWEKDFIFYQGGCAWWHFYPHEGVRQMEKKFNEIMKKNSHKQ